VLEIQSFLIPFVQPLSSRFIEFHIHEITVEDAIPGTSDEPSTPATFQCTRILMKSTGKFADEKGECILTVWKNSDLVNFLSEKQLEIMDGIVKQAVRNGGKNIVIDEAGRLYQHTKYWNTRSSEEDKAAQSYKERKGKL